MRRESVSGVRLRYAASSFFGMRPASSGCLRWKRERRPGASSRCSVMVCAITSRHQLHHLVLEALLELGIAARGTRPSRGIGSSAARTGHGDDRVRHRRSQPPRGVGSVHLGFGGEAQDHLAALGVAHHALHHALEDEELLHLLVALAHQRVALAVVGHQRQRLELRPLRLAHSLQQEVLPASAGDAVAFGMVGDRGMVGGDSPHFLAPL